MQTKNNLLYVTLLFCTSAFAATINLQSIDVNAELDEELLQDTVTKKSSSLAKEAKGETLGDFLQNEQFIDSASYGPAVGRPVVRGMDGYRVGISNGNIILNDLSAMSQDHAVGLMPRSSQKIELIKGPASLLYGNYSGGVIRVLGEEHEKLLLKDGYSLDTVSSYGSNGAGLILGATLKASDYNVSLFANTFYHDAEEYRDGNNEIVKDSDTLSQQSHIVLGYQLDKQNIFKIYLDEMKKEYGIPNSTQESTTIEMEQERYGLVWHSKDLFDVINHMQMEIQSSDYLHTEYEGMRADGRFSQKQVSLSTMLDFSIDLWEIKANVEYQNSDLEVCHEHGKCTKFFDAQRTAIENGVELQENIDIFGLPFAHGHPMPNINESLVKLGFLANNFIDDDNELTLALRTQMREINPDSKNIQEVWLVTPSIDKDYYDKRNDIGLSASVGLFSYLNDDLSLQTSLSYIQRLPSSTEMYWNGFHHATDSYIFGDVDLENEKSLNLDIDMMVNHGDFTTQVGGFYYHFYNYIYQEQLADADGELWTDPFHHSNVWAVQGKSARVFGLALKESYTKKISSHTLNVSLSFEAIRGLLLDGSNLPRIPTTTTTLFLEHLYKNYKANITYKFVDKSRFEADNETQTPSYSWLSAFVSYDDKNKFFDYSVYLKAENLTNEIAYNHLSFLKESAPFAGRQITTGLELHF